MRERVDIGGRRLSVERAGSGDVTVLFESGHGDTAAIWSRVTEALDGRHVRTLVYDRAGLGESDPATRPRTFRDAVDDLGSTVRAIDLRTPVVLVGLPRRVRRGAPRRVPAILLAKLALEARLQGQGLGGELLIRTLSIVVEAARHAGGKLVLVDAIDETAARFYQHHDLTPLPANSRRLVIKLSSVAKAIGVQWP